MADVFYGLDRGENEFDIVTQATSPGKDVEIAYDDAVSWEKSELVQKLQELINRIIKDDFPL